MWEDLSPEFVLVCLHLLDLLLSGCWSSRVSVSQYTAFKVASLFFIWLASYMTFHVAVFLIMTPSLLNCFVSVAPIFEWAQPTMLNLMASSFLWLNGPIIPLPTLTLFFPQLRLYMANCFLFIFWVLSIGGCWLLPVYTANSQSHHKLSRHFFGPFQILTHSHHGI